MLLGQEEKSRINKKNLDFQRLKAVAGIVNINEEVTHIPKELWFKWKCPQMCSQV